MPIYEYACKSCTNRFEKLQGIKSMNDAPPCPLCGSDSDRQLSVVSYLIADFIGETPTVTTPSQGGGCCGGACGC